MGVGRFFCVALPFALTIGSLIFLLIGSLAGVANKGLYIFRIDVENLTIDPTTVDSIIGNLARRESETKTTNITATDLDLGKFYDVSLWGYCRTDREGDRHCTKAKFNWAADALNTTDREDFGSAAGVDIQLPNELEDSLKAFTKVSKWTEVVFIAALVALTVEILLGIFANCSRIFSCFTYIVSGLATTLVIAAASLATALAAIVVGAVEGSVKKYSVTGKINTSFLSIVWIAAALAIGASLFWLLTICCCAPDHRSRSSRKNRHSDGEKLIPQSGTGYAPLGNDHEMTGGYHNHNQSQSQYGAPRYPSGAARSDLAYEPYAHRA